MKAKIEVVHNWSIEDNIQPLAREKKSTSRRVGVAELSSSLDILEI